METQLNFATEFNIGGLKWQGTLAEIASVNFNTINQELCDQAGRVGFFLSLQAQAQTERERLGNLVEKYKSDLKRIKADEFLKAKATKDATGKSPTDSLADSMAEISEPVGIANNNLFAVKEQYVCADGLVNQIHAFVKALENKKTSLEQLSNNLRKEATIS